MALSARLGSGSALARGYDLDVSDRRHDAANPDAANPDAANPHDRGSSLEPSAPNELITDGMPFESLTAPQPLNSAPPAQARWLGFAGIVIGGVLGGMIGWGTGDVLGQTTTWAAGGALIGAVCGAIGVGIVATLTLRAMNEWHAVQHPEERHGIIGETSKSEPASPTGSSTDRPTKESS